MQTANALQVNMLLSEFFKGAPDIEIRQLSTDSRMPMMDALFFCVKGVRDDGHQFVREAVINGAKAIVYEDDIDTDLNAVFIRVNNVGDTLNRVADRFYDYPGKSLETYTVSGCYGRSSVSSYIRQIVSHYKSCGSVGIMGISYAGRELMSSYATLPALSNLSYMSQMRKDNVKACTFESNALNLSFKKLNDVHPNVFVYTNTSHYSKDYRELGADYFSFLRKYFYTLDETTCVVLNRDDESFDELYDSCANYVTYGFDEHSDFFIHDFSVKKNGISYGLRYNGINVIVSAPLLGLCNIYNLTAAIAATVSMGYSLDEICEFTPSLHPVEGIYDKLEDDRFNIIIDAAYTADSLENIFDFGRYITASKKKLIGILGICYTDDDKKLETIAEFANKYLDFLIITEDDSYEHDTLQILQKMTDFDLKIRYLIIEERKSAIEEGIELLNSGDTLLILGKGNEVSLYKGLGKEYYDGDRKVAEMYLRKREEEENEVFEVY